MTVTNFPKVSGVNEEFTPSPNVTNNPNITGVGGGGTVIPKLLDLVGAPSAAAYSFKSLSDDYTGPVVSIRRADNTTQDFTAAECEDGTLATFLDGSTGFVTAWYDQSGGALDLVQATEADQPEVLVDDNGYFYTDTVSGNFVRCGTFVGATTNMTMHIVWQVVSDDAGSPLHSSFQGGIDFATNSYFMPWWTQANSPTFGGSTLTDFDWIDRKPRQHIWKFLNGTNYGYEFKSQSRVSFSATNPPYTRLTVGKNDIQNANARFYELVFWPSDVSVDPIFEATKANYPAWFSFRNMYLSVGDSNTSAGFANTSQQWTRKVYDGSSQTGPWYSRALGGNTIQHFLDNPEWITTYLNDWDCVNKTVTIFLGTNDIVGGATGLQTLARLEDLCDILRTAGATTINVVTCLPRTGTGFPDERDDYNAGILLNANGKWDNVIDTTSNPNLEDQNDSTYFADTTHLNDAGQTELANLIMGVF